METISQQRIDRAARYLQSRPEDVDEVLQSAPTQTPSERNTMNLTIDCQTVGCDAKRNRGIEADIQGANEDDVFSAIASDHDLLARFIDYVNSDVVLNMIGRDFALEHFGIEEPDEQPAQ